MSTTTDAPGVGALAVPAAGLLSWGQAGNYNAVDDRSVIASLFAAGRGRGGLIQPPTLTPQSGLTIAIGPWSAVADCGDGTKAVIGSRAVTSIDQSPGGASARADVLWADVSPDNGTYQVSIITEAAMPGRAGVFLGLMLVPASAATAAAMDLRPGNARVIGRQPATFPDSVANSAAQRTLATMLIPAYDAEVGAVYEALVWGSGQQASGTKRNMIIQSAIVGGASGLVGLTLGSSGWSGTSVTFRVSIIQRMICRSVGVNGLWQSELEVVECEQGSFISPGNSTMNCGVTCESTANVAQDTTRDIPVAIQAWWDSASGGPTFTGRVAVMGRVA